MKTPTKRSVLVRLALIALPAAALLALGGAPILARTAARTQLAKTDPAPAKADDAAQGDNPLMAGEDTDGVAAVVNDQVVTEYDLRQRLALVVATSGMQPTPDTIKRLRPQVLDQLKTEKLELEEAQRKNITVSPNEVDKEIDGIVKDNHLTLDGLKEILAKDNVAFETLRAQIAVQLAWQKAIEDEYGDRINITDQDVSEELQRIAQGADKPHFLVSEIFLAIDNPDQADVILKNANDLEAQIRDGAPFASIARQFSQSPSAAGGGDIGWVNDGQLAPELNDALEKLTPGSISPPIRAAGGYYILALRERQEPQGSKLPDPAAAQSKERPGYLPLARMLFPLPPKAPPTYIQNATKIADMVRSRIASCPQLQKMASAIKGSVFMNLGDMKLSDLSKQMQDALAKTQPGEPTEPFISPAGIEVIARCDKAAPKVTAFVMPTRQQVEQQLFQKQISMLARQYIRDLRREANVETR